MGSSNWIGNYGALRDGAGALHGFAGKQIGEYPGQGRIGGTALLHSKFGGIKNQHLGSVRETQRFRDQLRIIH